MLKNILLIMVIIIFSFKLYAFTQDRIFIITPSISGNLGNYSSDYSNKFTPSVSLDASYVLSDNFEAGIGISMQEAIRENDNFNSNQNELAIPFYVLMKSNILINYKSSISFYSKIGTIVGNNTTTDANVNGISTTDMDIYASFGVDYVYYNIVLGLEYKAIGCSQYSQKSLDDNTSYSTRNYYNRYIGVRLGYNIYTVVTPVVE